MKSLLMPILIALAAFSVTAAHAENETAAFVVVSISGTAPISAPVPDLPTRTMREGESLDHNSSWLFPPNTEIELKHLPSGEYAHITGPARIKIGEHRIEIHGQKTLSFPTANE